MPLKVELSKQKNYSVNQFFALFPYTSLTKKRIANVICGSRRKTFICEKCGDCIRIGYEGSTLMMQIGDFEVMRQQKIAEELGE